jgi:hypothetical protein
VAPDADAELAASLLLACWSTAYLQAHQRYRISADEAQAQRVLARVEQAMRRCRQHWPARLTFRGCAVSRTLQA